MPVTLKCSDCGAPAQRRLTELRPWAWESDLCDRCCELLASKLDALIDSPRLGIRQARSRSAIVNGRAPYPAAAGVDLSVVRRWARANGVAVSDRGRISADVIARYRAAHPGQD